MEYLHTYHLFGDSFYQRTSERSTWTMFIDYGNRLLPCYGNMFYLNAPMQPLDHILCVGTPSDYKPTAQLGAATEEYSLSRGLASAVKIKITDVTEMGFEDMLFHAGALPGTDEARDIFVRGRADNDEKYIHVNPEQDGEVLGPDNIDVSIDIDSLIWVTDKLTFKLGVKVHLTPSIGPMAIIPRSNHVYVHLLMPPSDPNGLAGGRSEWIEKRIPLSNIPHTRFASVVEGHGPFTAYIFFPRMRHKSEYTNRWQVMMPYELQEMLYEQVIIPAVRTVLGPETEPYIGYTVQEFKLKSASKSHRKGNPARGKVVDVRPADLIRIQNEMRSLIENSPTGLLDRFGSFFFVLEGKGTKLASQVNLSRSQENPWELFQKSYPVLDAPAMLSHTRGELLVDVGFCFVPRAPNPMVGLWRLDALEASYGRGGYSRGTMHTGNTLARYGGMQAEMLQARAERTHIAFRSSYNLYYEATRTHDNRPIFATDGDAYNLNEPWSTDCNRLLELYKGSAPSNSYGVRDEYRIGGRVVEQLMTSCREMANTFILSQPILWVTSDLWFRWLSRRLDELMAVQMSLYRTRPTNYGRITGVLTHLIRSVETTPIIVPGHVLHSLGDLQMRQNRSRFGMMFLHNLNMTSPELALMDIEDFDSQDVLAALKIRKKFNPRTNPANSGPSIAYPLGEYPTWNAVQTAVRDEPWNIIRQYDMRYLPLLIIVRRAFQSFTAQMWDMLNEIYFTSRGEPEVTTLEQAMKAWSLGTVFDSITKVSWDAINTGCWKNIRGPKEVSFKDRVKMYFPESQEIASNSAALRPFYLLRTGYLSRFWRDIAELDEEERQDVYDELGEIFSSIQCLPATRISRNDGAILPGNTWQTMNGSIRIITNPAHYMIKGIGEERNARRAQRSSRAVVSERAALERQLERQAVPQKDRGRMIKAAIGSKSTREKKMEERRSKKSKNMRAPPGAKKQGSSSSSGSSTSGDGYYLDEEGSE
ncbi:uncharacterized protein C8Q71DRAFT_860168 [Rhodofomes roseus]|uniref:Uncharacterized protein n=1 Tax=Rhodofomes roseus TaxID=34475 RepID=A0ABQ8K9B6_9APHY|nr:uncharacterized protein C8Q71DRAFT_860168 [Rhodofomes roseus]KAH9833898.1 hypothetical protein C8Q71DRAFT_860168 [Rhodofomes roseus]